MVGFWRTETIASAVELGVFEALPGSVEELAHRCGLRPERALRLLRGLGELSLVEATATTWHTTRRGEYLMGDHPLTLAGAASEYARHFAPMWKALPEAVRSNGEWRTPDVFGDVARDEARFGRHHRMLVSYARHDYSTVPAALQLRGDERVVDAGGGLGALAAALVQGQPGLHVVVFDRPEVIQQAKSDLAANLDIEFQAGDLFEDWGLRADAVVLARVVHDWGDADAMRILRRARAVLDPGGRLFVVEMVVPEGGVAGALCDLHLLMVTGGQERTAVEYGALLAEAGFELTEVLRLAALPSVVVGVAR
jgi:SAM-dependent methyltransferase